MTTKYKFMHVFHTLNFSRNPMPLLENYKNISKPMLFTNQTHIVCQNIELGFFERVSIAQDPAGRELGISILFCNKMWYFFDAKFLWFSVPSLLTTSTYIISLRKEEWSMWFDCFENHIIMLFESAGLAW